MQQKLDAFSGLMEIIALGEKWHQVRADKEQGSLWP